MSAPVWVFVLMLAAVYRLEPVWAYSLALELLSLCLSAQVSGGSSELPSACSSALV